MSIFLFIAGMILLAVSVGYLMILISEGGFDMCPLAIVSTIILAIAVAVGSIAMLNAFGAKMSAEKVISEHEICHFYSTADGTPIEEANERIAGYNNSLKNAKGSVFSKDLVEGYEYIPFVNK